MHYRDTKENLFKIKSNYRYICSGTPYSSKKDIEEILTYLSNFNGPVKLKGIKHILPRVISRYFRKNTKETVNNEVNIPQPHVDTEFLTMTTIERALYDSALGNRDKMIEYCNHIMVSDENISILGNKPLPLDQIHSKMTEHYSKKIVRQEKRLEIIQNELQNIENTDENSLNSKLDIADQINSELRDNRRKLEIFQGLSSKLEEEECPVCYEKLKDLVKAITPCGHVICGRCIGEISRVSSTLECPMCRTRLNSNNLEAIAPDNFQQTNQLGTKVARLISYCNSVLENSCNRIIVFSQWENMLKLVSSTLGDNGVKHLILNGSMYVMNSKIRQFKLDESIRIILLCSERAASGLNLTCANHIVLLDTLNNDKESSQIIEEQAIGRAVRIGQNQNVNVKRFIMKETIEEEYYHRNID